GAVSSAPAGRSRRSLRAARNARASGPTSEKAAGIPVAWKRRSVPGRGGDAAADGTRCMEAPRGLGAPAGGALLLLLLLLALLLRRFRVRAAGDLVADADDLPGDVAFVLIGRATTANAAEIGCREPQDRGH